MVRAFGSPAGVLRQVSRISTRLDTSAVLRCLRAENGRAELTWRVLPPQAPSRIDCDYTVGMLMQVPVLFGLPPARVEHLTCQVDGAHACSYTVTWRPWRRTAPWRRRPQGLPIDAPVVREADGLLALQEVVDGLPRQAPVEATLDRVTAEADRVVHGPGHLLDVRLPQGARHLRARGLGRTVLEDLGDVRLGAGVQQVAGLTLVAVPVVTATRRYGVLAVVVWPGQELLAPDVELLSAYARQAAAAIEASMLLDEAREQEETARLLLSVARSLAGRRSVRQISQTVAEAVPALCRADRATVALWEPGEQSVWMAGLAGWPAELADRAAAFMASAEESPELSHLVAGGAPLLVDRTGSPWAREVLDAFGVTAFAAVPIRVADTLVGILIAHWADTPAPTALGEALTERLWGLAGLAGVALDSTRLLAEMDHLSSHDELTGLPNRSVFDARLQSALEDAAATGAPVTVLVADVDRLKRINDGLGREAGDHVLVEVAGRLAGTIREGDTICRWGDAFLVLLSGVGQRRAEQVTGGIRAALDRPVRVDDDDVYVGLTIGAAAAAGRKLRELLLGTDPARQLVEQATARMHEARRGTRSAVAAVPGSPEVLRLKAELHGAVGRGEIHVFFQPQVEVAGGRVVGVEALAGGTTPRRRRATVRLHPRSRRRAD